jgi:hypothetical protein
MFCLMFNMETQYSEYVTQSELQESQLGSFYRGMLVGVLTGGGVVCFLTLSTCLNM